jgi:hypothetical protein
MSGAPDGRDEPIDSFRPFRPAEQSPPAYRPVTDIAGMRFAHVFEVAPELMVDHVRQQKMPNWDVSRIVRSRHEHLAWMTRHWADITVSGERILSEIEKQEKVSKK